MKRLIKPTAAILGLVVIACAWYATAANYDYGALAGAYVLNVSGERCTIDLHSDHTFTQELARAGVVDEAQGTWHRYGQAHVSFSREFIAVSGQELNADNQAHGEFGKTFGLLPFLTLAPLPDGPRLRRKLFR